MIVLALHSARSAILTATVCMNSEWVQFITTTVDHIAEPFMFSLLLAALQSRALSQVTSSPVDLQPFPRWKGRPSVTPDTKATRALSLAGKEFGRGRLAAVCPLLAEFDIF